MRIRRERAEIAGPRSPEPAQKRGDLKNSPNLGGTTKQACSRPKPGDGSIFFTQGFPCEGGNLWRAFCRGGALLRPRRRHRFHDHLRRIRTALRADVGIGPYGPIIRKPTGEAEPRPYNLPRKKVTPIKISVAPSIDSKNSTATSYKFDIPVSGGAYQDAREVTSEWNDA